MVVKRMGFNWKKMPVKKHFDGKGGHCGMEI
jgi:hypothetical protein